MSRRPNAESLFVRRYMAAFVGGAVVGGAYTGLQRGPFVPGLLVGGLVAVVCATSWRAGEQRVTGGSPPARYFAGLFSLEVTWAVVWIIAALGVIVWGAIQRDRQTILFGLLLAACHFLYGRFNYRRLRRVEDEHRRGRF
jgi:bacteriorhodopsin